MSCFFCLPAFKDPYTGHRFLCWTPRQLAGPPHTPPSGMLMSGEGDLHMLGAEMAQRTLGGRPGAMSVSCCVFLFFFVCLLMLVFSRGHT